MATAPSGVSVALAQSVAGTGVIDVTAVADPLHGTIDVRVVDWNDIEKWLPEVPAFHPFPQMNRDDLAARTGALENALTTRTGAMLTSCVSTSEISAPSALSMCSLVSF
mgnify:CR=1 FL=1